MNKRELWIDVTKIFAIFLVVVSHTFSIPPEGSVQYLGGVFLLAIIKTCVPLFVMASGYLLLGKHEERKLFYQKRLTRVAIPWVSWALVLSIIEVIFYSSDRGVFQTLSLWWFNLITFYWFIPLILGLYILTPILRNVIAAVSQKDLILLLVLWFAAVCLLPYIHNGQLFPLETDLAFTRKMLIFTGYYLLGYAVIRYSDKAFQSLKTSLLFICTGLLITVTGTVAALTNPSVDYPLYFMSYDGPGTVLLSIGIFLLFFLKRSYFDSIRWSKAKVTIGILGMMSLGIYLFHDIFVKLNRFYGFNVILVPENLFINGLLIGVLLFIFSYIVLVFLYQIPGVRKLFV